MASSGLRAGLLQEILTMAVDTLRTNKMRSALTILGVVIGITSIVSMTALIRGFDESFKDLFRQIGPEHDVRDEVQLRQLLAGQGVPRPDQAAEHHDRGRARRSSARRWSNGGAAARRRPGHAARAVHLRQQRHQADGRDRRQRQLRRDQLDPARGRPRLHPGRGRSPAPRSSCSATRPARRSSPPPIRSASRCASAGTSTPWSASSASGRTRSAAARPTSSRSSRTRPGRRSTAPTRCASSASSTATCRSS